MPFYTSSIGDTLRWAIRAEAEHDYCGIPKVRTGRVSLRPAYVSGVRYRERAIALIEDAGLHTETFNQLSGLTPSYPQRDNKYVLSAFDDFDDKTSTLHEISIILSV